MARREEILTQRRRDAEEAWPVVRLGDVCEEMRERIPSSNVSLECYITTDNMVKGCGGVRIADNVPEAVGLVRYQKGDVLLSNIRPYLKKSWLADRDGGCSSDVIVFRSLHSDLSPEYLFRVLSQDGFFDYSMQNVSGTKMPRGKRDWIKAFQFPLPPLPIQREIVARLEKELGEADKLAAKFKRVAELADDAFKAELDETFKALEDNSRRDTETRRVRLGDVCEFVRNGANIKQRKGAVGIPITRIETLSGGVFNSQKVGYADIMNKEPFEKHIVGIGDLLISHINSAQFVGRTVMYRGEINGPIIHGMNLLRARLLDSGKILPAYVELWFKTISARIYISGVTKKSVNQASVNTTDFKRMPIIRPPISTQRAIVAKLDAAKERCERMKSAAMRGLAAAENLRKAILAEAFEQ